MRVGAPRLPAIVKFRAPAILPAAVEVAARAQFTSPAEYLRRAVLQALRKDGINPHDLDVEAR